MSNNDPMTPAGMNPGPAVFINRDSKHRPERMPGGKPRPKPTRCEHLTPTTARAGERRPLQGVLHLSNEAWLTIDPRGT